MRLIVITSDTTHENENVNLIKMLKSGLPTLHIRKPTYSTQRLQKYLAAIPSEFHNRLVIHTHHRMMCKYNLKGIHLTRVHKKRQFRNWITEKLIKMKRIQYSKSTVCNSFSSVAENYPLFDYVMLTPVFSESLDHKSAFSFGALNEMIKKYPGKVIARGGTSPDSINDARELGFAGIAFQTYIWSNEDPFAQYQKILNKFAELGIAVE